MRVLVGFELDFPKRASPTWRQEPALGPAAPLAQQHLSQKAEHETCHRAHHYQSLVLRNGGKSIGELAAEAGVTGSYFTRILRLSFLAPTIVTSILNDRHPVDLTAKRLANEVDLPVSWERKSALLGAC